MHLSYKLHIQKVCVCVCARMRIYIRRPHRSLPLVSNPGHLYNSHNIQRAPGLHVVLAAKVILRGHIRSCLLCVCRWNDVIAQPDTSLYAQVPN